MTIITGDTTFNPPLEHGNQVDEHSSGVHVVVGNIVGTSDSQVLANKTITDTTNSCRATALGTAGPNVVISSTAPTVGQILQASNSTNASWQTQSFGTPSVGFLAYNSTTSILFTDGVGQTLLAPFSNVNWIAVYNDGGAYNEATNTFTAPFNGYYQVNILIIIVVDGTWGNNIIDVPGLGITLNAPSPNEQIQVRISMKDIPTVSQTFTNRAIPFNISTILKMTASQQITGITLIRIIPTGGTSYILGYNMNIFGTGNRFTSYSIQLLNTF